MLNTVFLVLALVGVVGAVAAIPAVITRRRTARLARLANMERDALDRDEVDVAALAESVGYLARGVLSADLSRANVVRRPYRWSKPGELAEADLRGAPARPLHDLLLPVPRNALDDITGFYPGYPAAALADPAPTTSGCSGSSTGSSSTSSSSPSADTGSSGFSGGGD